MKIFLSSTILDLRDLRDTLVQGLEADGHEVIASEKGTVLVNPDKSSYEQCLAAVIDCDCLIAILDGRFGGEYPIGSNKSITEAEIEVALTQNKKTLVFVRQSVWDCKATQNALGKGRKGIPYEAVKNIVEDPRVFDLIDRIRKKPKDNWIFQFNFPTDLLSQIRAQIKLPTPQINWHKACTELLNIQKQQLTSPLQQRQARSLDEVHVPLGLVERKEKSLPKFDREQEFSPDKGSEAYHQTETKPIEHDAFLAAVRDRQPGQHLVILGEPGAGKTTLLTKVWQSLLENVDRDADIIVAWVPLAAVGDRLEDYLKQVWLRKVCDDEDLATYWESFRSLRQNGRVWLLLDGADEMGGDALRKIETTLQENWARSIRAIVTCRLNLWDTSPSNSLNSSPNFQIYRTLDFKYVPKDLVGEFIGRWFKDKAEVGKKLRSALDEAGKERIKDLVQNPLRLTLLFEIWEDKPELPDTQAQLYKSFVERVHQWNESKFPHINVPQAGLDRSMGELAKRGINKPTLRFRFGKKELANVKHFQALKDLGWLNCVGEDEHKQKVYAFFHPTFQEYFAACAIDDWDYFLPRAHDEQPVSCQGEDVPTYRVFGKQWQQVIVFWIGRNFKNELKEEFLVKLTNFCDGTSEFYYYQAYCIAAICVGEFQSSQYAESIVQRVVNWAFGYFDPIEQAWVNLELVNSTLASETLLLTQRQHLITYLLPLLFQNDLSDDEKLNRDSIYTRLHAISILGKTAKGNTKVIEELTSFICKSDNDLIRITTAEALGTIDIGSHLALTIIIKFFCNPSLYKYDVLALAARSLGRISIGNESVIQELLYILSQLQNTDDFRQSIIINTLAEIAVGHMETLDILISMFQSSPVFPLLHIIEDALIQIASNNKYAIKMIDCNLSKANQNKDIEPYLSRILQWVNNDDKKETVSIHNLFLDPKMNFFHEQEVLGTIEIGDEQATKELSAIILSLNVDNPRLFLAAHTLGRIDIGNKLAITTLLKIISQPDLDNYSLREIVYSLKIAVGDRDAIEMLLGLLSKPNLSNSLKYIVADTLWHIDIGNNKAMNTLLDIFSQSDWDDSLPMGTGESLNEIITIEMMPMVVNKLKYQVTTDTCKSNYKKFYICKTVIWKCAQFLPYHEFHAAWHQS
jgi:HEAT repeat protein